VIGADDLTASNTYIEAELEKRLKKVEEVAGADVLVCVHPILQPFDDLIRDHVEDIKDRRESLLVILETEGGSIETTERIADVLRHHYPKEITFLVPNYAMSAGTILVMSGDRIMMDYYSVLGPIDPQIRNQNGQTVPALGYLEQYKQLIAKSSKGKLTNAELAFMIEKFDPAQLHRLEQAREHSVDLLKRWLVEYKFKNWTETKDRKVPVTHKMKQDRAKEIANKLNDTRLWRSHGRGLSMQVIQNALNLLVDDFGQDSDLNGSVRAYYRLLKDYMGRRGHTFGIQTKERLFSV
jgi:hypothetical protein